MTTLTPARPATLSGLRVVETSRGTAHPEHDRMREMVVQSLLVRADRIGAARG